jgi:kynurenine formamidase
MNDYVIANPGLAADASKFLVENKVNSVAIDSPSIDVGTDNNNFISNRCFGDRESL